MERFLPHSHSSAQMSICSIPSPGKKHSWKQFPQALWVKYSCAALPGSASKIQKAKNVFSFLNETFKDKDAFALLREKQDNLIPTMPTSSCAKVIEKKTKVFSAVFLNKIING